MLLSELFPLPKDFPNPQITGLTLDSRTVQPGDLFFALAGTHTHGEIYIDTALQKGAVAILKETSGASVERLAGDIPCLNLPNLSQQVGNIAAQFYDHPTRHLKIIGVTGTNGKTSITHFIAQLLHSHSPCGLIGTLGNGLYGALQPGLHTTPDAIQLQSLFAQWREQSVPWAVMEVSSHALVQGRVNGITFDTAVFTNLSRDHLDYHQTMEAYGEAKQRLFHTPQLRTAVINYDDPYGQHLLAHLPSSVTPLTYSIQHASADFYANILHSDTTGSELEIQTPQGSGQVHSPLLGQFNVSNLLAALAVLLNLGRPLTDLLQSLHTLRPVPGRMEHFGQPHQPTVIVDYAHTPDALQQTLTALRPHCHSNLWCIFGCGGNRDRGKRPLMGDIAQRYADKVILTNDNPRHEEPQTILDDILQGMTTPPVAIIPDRSQAIRDILQQATKDDIIVIAGKGHEDYQQIGDQRLPFSDRQLVISLLMDNE